MAQDTNPPEYGDETCAPVAMTCIHVVEGTAAAVVPVPSGDGSGDEVDYICDECWERFSRHGNRDPNDLRAVCRECLPEIVKPYVSKVHAFMERLGCDPNDCGAFRMIQSGLKSGLPLCCISFFVLMRRRRGAANNRQGRRLVNAGLAV